MRETPAHALRADWRGRDLSVVDRRPGLVTFATSPSEPWRLPVYAMLAVSCLSAPVFAWHIHGSLQSGAAIVWLPLLGIAALLVVCGIWAVSASQTTIEVDAGNGRVTIVRVFIDRRRQSTYRSDEIEGFAVERQADGDGDADYALVLKLRHGPPLELFRSDSAAAAQQVVDEVARLVQRGPGPA